MLFDLYKVIPAVIDMAFPHSIASLKANGYINSSALDGTKANIQASTANQHILPKLEL